MDMSNQDSVLHFSVLTLFDTALVRILMQIIKSNGFFCTQLFKNILCVCVMKSVLFFFISKRSCGKPLKAELGVLGVAVVGLLLFS